MALFLSLAIVVIILYFKLLKSYNALQAEFISETKRFENYRIRKVIEVDNIKVTKDQEFETYKTRQTQEIESLKETKEKEVTEYKRLIQKIQRYHALIDADKLKEINEYKQLASQFQKTQDQLRKELLHYKKLQQKPLEESSQQILIKTKKFEEDMKKKCHDELVEAQQRAQEIIRQSEAKVSLAERAIQSKIEDAQRVADQIKRDALTKAKEITSASWQFAQSKQREHHF